MLSQFIFSHVIDIIKIFQSDNLDFFLSTKVLLKLNLGGGALVNKIL